MKMVGKLKKKFLHVDYQVNFLKRMKSLRQKDMIVKHYIEEFYKLDIRYGHVDNEVEKVPRYLNSLRTSIQDEISFVEMESIKEAYLYDQSVKEAYFYDFIDEEILKKKHKCRQRTRDGRFQKSRGRSYAESRRLDSTSHDKGKSKDNAKRGRGNYCTYSRSKNIGQREDRSWFKGTCFKCGEEGHIKPLNLYYLVRR